jgi:DNA invertase Pin-like site-specific DNA recombinase
MLIGYARVSTQEQTLDLQRDALRQAGCEKIYTDTVSGATTERKGLEQALAHLRPEDTLVVWRLDRLGRTLPHLLQTVMSLEQQGVGFKSLTESIDTTSSSGKLIFQIFGALAEFERNLIRERTLAGLEAARARGRLGGRPKLSSDNKKAELAKSLYQDRSRTVQEICQALHISRATFYRYLNQK